MSVTDKSASVDRLEGYEVVMNAPSPRGSNTNVKNNNDLSLVDVANKSPRALRPSLPRLSLG